MSSNNNLINTKEIQFYELEKKVYNLVCGLGCTIIKNILEMQDKKLMENRDKKVWIYVKFLDTFFENFFTL